MSWPSLPPALRVRIFQHIYSAEANKTRPYASPAFRKIRRHFLDLASETRYASVNSEWQQYFEAENFQRLILDHTDIVDFGKIVTRRSTRYRANLIRWIWLRVTLPEYDCSQCSQPQTNDGQVADETRITTAVWHLFRYLSVVNDGRANITLELSAHSPSDEVHYCQELKNIMTDTEWHVSTDRVAVPDDAAHGWRNGKRKALTMGAYRRVFGDPIGIGIMVRANEDVGLDGFLTEAEQQTLPRTRAVTGLVIRLQFLKHVSIRYFLYYVMRALPELRSLRYEFRGGAAATAIRPNSSDLTIRRADHRYLIEALLPRFTGLRSLCLFEAGNSFNWVRGVPPAAPDLEMGRDLAHNGKHLWEIHVGRLVDARDFFYMFWPYNEDAVDFWWPREVYLDSYWPHLRHLSLTTRLLACAATTEPLIRAAGLAAERMPRLVTMKLWDAVRESDKRFYYYHMVGQQRHVVVVPNEMAFKLPVDIYRSWRRVAGRYGPEHTLLALNLSYYDPGGGQADEERVWRGPLTRTSAVQLRMEQERIEGGA